MSALKKEMPSMFGKENKKKELIKNLDTIYATLQRVSFFYCQSHYIPLKDIHILILGFGFVEIKSI